MKKKEKKQERLKSKMTMSQNKHLAPVFQEITNKMDKDVPNNKTTLTIVIRKISDG